MLQNTIIRINYTGKELLKISFPLMLGSILEVLYNLTDTYFLGKLGVNAVGAPSITFNVIFFLMILGIGISGAGTTLIAQSRGQGNPGKMRHYLNQMAFLVILFGVVLGAIGILVTPSILRLLQTPQAIFSNAQAYMQIILAGMPFSFIYFILQSGYAAIGKTKVPFIVHLCSVLLNVILDPLLIYGIKPFPALGVTGAALATVIAQGVAALVSLYILTVKRGVLRLRIHEMKPQLRSWSLFFKIGLPSSIGQGLSALGFSVLQGLVNSFGPGTIAAFGVGNRIMSLFDIPTHSLATGVTSLSGRAMGAKQDDKLPVILRQAVLILTLLEIPLLSASVIWGGDLVRFFVNDPETVRLGDIMFKLVSPSLYLFGLYMVLTGVFQGAGDTKIIMILAIARLWGIRVPTAYLLASSTPLGPLSIWIGMFVSNFLTALIGFLYFRTERWRVALAKHAI